MDLTRMDLSRVIGQVFVRERFCQKHHEPVVDVCLFTGNCRERFLCDECREVHNDDHMKFLEHFDTVFSDTIIDKITKTIRIIEEKNEQAVLANQDVLEKVENIFKELESFMIRSIAEAKNKTIDKILYLLTGNASNIREWTRLKTELTNIQKSLTNDDEDSPIMEQYLKIYYEAYKRLRFVKYNQHVLKSNENLIRIDEKALEQSFKNATDLFQNLTDQILEDAKNIQKMDISNNKLVCLNTINSGGKGVNWGGLAFVKKFNFLVRGGIEGDIKIWDATTHNVIKSFRAHNGWINVILSMDGINKIASAGEDNYIRLWDLNDNFRAVSMGGHTSVIFALEYIPEENRLASGGAEPNIKIWNLVDYRVEYELGSLDQSNIGSLRYIPNKKLLAAGSYDGSILIFDLKQRSLVKRVIGHSPNFLVLSLKFIEKENMLISGSMDGTVRVWKVETADSIYQILKLKVGPHVDNLCYLDDQGILVASTGDKYLKFYEMQSGQMLYQLDGYEQRGRALIYAKDLGHIITADYDSGLVKVFGPQTF